MSFGPARADTTFDMATFTCQDWLDASDDERDLILVWLRGYLGGRAGTSLDYPDATRTDRTKMEIFCRGSSGDRRNQRDGSVAALTARGGALRRPGQKRIDPR